MEANKKMEMFQFLAGIFHQDIESTEKALEEYLEENSTEVIKQDAELIQQFMDWEASENEKNEFIEQHTWIYFPEMKQPPISWLRDVKSLMLKKVNE
ncbi:hypothetical protein C8P63_110107 [Melghirimyces profundicolus]|uniref:CdiI immunity protein domain-containing protein n=1 Tax=Melghirimyces profundicolus TaxID=1242148 RepID=A0A2T6BV91_9BACL|nr:contact-dependent growth inhibition system immunity protein [Melghirimyces profundicolus]PTX59962.1 hypothetical protein C8P63_110107 [Melghirimyces profundicolus]